MPISPSVTIRHSNWFTLELREFRLRAMVLMFPFQVIEDVPHVESAQRLRADPWGRS